MQRAASPTEHDQLDAVVRALSEGRTASELLDAEGRLVWVSEQLRTLVGAEGDDELDIGNTLAHMPGSEVWKRVLTEDALDTLSELHAAQHDGGNPPPALAVRAVDVVLAGRRRTIGLLSMTLRDSDGSRLGTALIFAPLLPARILAMVSEGDEAMFTRMADLTTPAQRPGAVVFADIDGSGVLSRHLPTPAYFELIRAVTTALDDVVGRYGGIVGTHAGDGASAFFLSTSFGGDSAAARAALTAVREMTGAVRTVVEDLAAGGVAVRPDDCRLNVGAHWGASLYIGQVVTGGRLEVTALGDEVNECARVEHVASHGQVLVTKTLLERLDADDAEAVGVAPRELTYRMLAELTDDDTKALRDAGSLAVHDLAP